MKPPVVLPSPDGSPAPSAPPENAFLVAQREAIAGKYTCKRCSKKGSLKEAVALHYGGAVALTMCTDCFLQVDVILTRSADGIQIQIRPRSIVVVAGQ